MKRTWKKHYIGLAVPQSMVIEMDNTIWQSFMKMQSEWNEISNRLSIGIGLRLCKAMIWQSRNAKNLELHCNYASQQYEQFVNFRFAGLTGCRKLHKNTQQAGGLITRLPAFMSVAAIFMWSSNELPFGHHLWKMQLNCITFGVPMNIWLCGNKPEAKRCGA